MFTGIVREVGRVERLDRGEGGARVRVATSMDGELREGDSVAVAGACLTVIAAGEGGFEADVMNQTLSLTTLGELEPGDGVNLEPALRAGEPLGGHMVQGHVDGTGRVESVTEDGIATRVAVIAPPELHPYLVERGSVTVDGVSLTLAAVTADGFEVSLVPETLQRTTLGALAPGDRVNLETDVIARYAERLVQGLQTKGTPNG